MKSLTLSLLLVFLLNTVVNCQNGVYPASGLYVGLNENFIYSEGINLSNELVNNISNAAFPDVSGKSGSVSYTFSSFKLALSLDEFYYLQSDATDFELGWQDAQFQMQWNYHVCDTVCEDGYVQVYTTGNNGTLIVATDLSVNFDQSSTSISATGTYMVFGIGEVQINVQCTNAICVIPVSDIAQEVAQNFVTQATTTITNTINQKAPSIAALLNPIQKIPFTLKGETYLVDCEGIIVESSTANSYTPTMTMAANGGVIVQNPDGSYVYPTQTPSYIPPDYQLENFTSDYLLSFTPFFFESFLDAAFVSEFPYLITPAMVPSASPITLNTSDPFFNQSAPEMTEKYPDQAISVNLHDPVTPVVTILENNVIVLNNTQISADFIINYDGETLDLFSLLFTIDIEVVVSLNINAGEIQANTTMTSFTPDASLINSEVGDVETVLFVQLLQLLQGAIKIPILSYPIPSTITLESFVFNTQQDLFQIAFDFVKNT